MLSIPHQKFCEGLLIGLTRTAAYAAAYPAANSVSARSRGSRLYRQPHIQSELSRLRGKADEIAGAAVLSHVEILTFLARIVRSRSGKPDEDTDLGKTIKAGGIDAGIRARDKLYALNLACKLAPPPAATEPNALLAGFYEIIRRIRTEAVPPQQPAPKEDPPEPAPQPDPAAQSPNPEPEKPEPEPYYFSPAEDRLREMSDPNRPRPVFRKPRKQSYASIQHTREFLGNYR